ncbi:PD-(D/E)XK nuclease family protein [Rhodococcus qingshengii]|uniref:PD-(D/E)XK nuclease family protein n=1 Tax=Rhodococcus qingshengii TaxID=334542 RepID=UPI0036DBF0A5
MVDAAHVEPCRSCADCKIAGTCADLIPLRSVIGQPTPGVSTRSVSASELAEYGQCPARWLLNRHLHLPKETAVTQEQDRGLSVHRWLARAHSRGVQCTPADIAESSGGLGLAEGVLSGEQFAIAEPFLVRHLEVCPFSQPECSLVAVEKTVYGFDSDADVIAVLKPDLVYRQRDQLIVRETKTSLDIKVQTRDEAYDKYLQVPFSLQAMRSGLLERYGAQVGVVELEILSPSSQRVWRWETTHSILAAVAAGDIRRAAEEWHDDLTWETKPGPQCGWCPVRGWCPDGDVHSLGLPTTGTGSVVPPDDDLAPF